MIPGGDHSDPLNPCRNDEMGMLIGDTLDVLSPDDDVGEMGFKEHAKCRRWSSTCHAAVFCSGLPVFWAGGSDLFVTVQLALHAAWHPRLPFDGRFGLPLPRPSISFSTSPTPSKAWNRPRPGTVASLMYARSTPSMRQRDQATKRPSSVRSMVHLAFSIGSWPSAWSGHPRVTWSPGGGPGGGGCVSQVIFDISLVCAKGSGVAPCLESG